MDKKNKAQNFHNLTLEEFLEMMEDGFCFFDNELRYVYVNTIAAGYAKKSKEELLGKKVYALFPEVEHMEAFQMFKNTKQIGKMHFDYYSPDLEKWFYVSVYPTSFGIGVAIKDVTAQKKAEKDAKESHDVLSAFFDNSPVFLAIYDEKMNIVDVDPETAKLYMGKDRTEVIGKSLQEVMPKSAQVLTPAFNTVLENKLPIFIESPVYDVHGDIHYVTASRFPLIIANGEKGIGVIALDVTERVQNEQRKDVFIAMASHELKTPLTSAKLLTEMLQKHFKELRDENSWVLSQKVGQRIAQLEGLIRSLLDSTIIQQGKLSLQREVFILRDHAFETVRELQQTTSHKIVVDWQTSEHLYADKEKVSQIFTNFITNAMKYSSDDKDIIIRSKKEEDFIVVSVQDFGIGIPREEKLHIFERFYQSYKHQTYPGLGLGLYIAKAIIMQMGGQIWLESEEGKGSTFYFSLPIYKGAIAKPVNHAISHTPLSKADD